MVFSHFPQVQVNLFSYVNDAVVFFKCSLGLTKISKYYRILKKKIDTYRYVYG